MYVYMYYIKPRSVLCILLLCVKCIMFHILQWPKLFKKMPSCFMNEKTENETWREEISKECILEM